MQHHITKAEKSRRQFIKTLSLGIGATLAGIPAQALKNLSPFNEHQGRNRLGIALVGLGQYSANMLAPALQQTQHCRLTGIVTGTPAKATVWKAKYDIPDKNIYDYENFDQIADNPDIDVVYVVLPISMHKEFTIRAAKAGKHVICEKPMAMNAMEAQEMIDACKANGVQLSIGYRLHYEPFNMHTMELGQERAFGEVKSIYTVDSGDLTGGNMDIWRLRKHLAGGGPLMDLGIYCVQAACYNTGRVPVAVTARYGEVTHPQYFYEVEQSITWQMDFGDGILADCRSSYAEAGDQLDVQAENGWWRLEPAFGYDGKQGRTVNDPIDLQNICEQVRQMDSQAMSFMTDTPTITPGEMGLRDMKMLMAIYESANANGRRIELQWDEEIIEATGGDKNTR